MQIVIATRNVHKIREFREMVGSTEAIDFLSLLDFPDYHAPEENGKTFEENAVLKAQHAAKELEKWVIADDSGLVVPALNGKPGVRSRRYAGEEATDKENNQKLLKALEGKTELERAAYYECCIALAGPEGLKKTVCGRCEGHIIEKGRGSNGFGYDPLFVKHDYEKTFGQLEETTKNRISHRRKAFDKLLPTLETLCTASTATT